MDHKRETMQEDRMYPKFTVLVLKKILTVVIIQESRY